MSAIALIAIDWGTTAARAYRLSAGGTVIDARDAPLGISQVPAGGYPDALATLLGDWRDDRAPRLASGMVGSRQGWTEAPYIECPASLDSLAAGIVRVPDGSLSIVPGLLTRDAHGIPDVMRGEETQLVGAVGRDEPEVLAVLPGTHSKWSHLQRGRVIDFATYMTGELFGLLLNHSILGRMATRESPATGDAFEHGVRRGLADGALAHDIFGARTQALTGALAPEGVPDWLSGLLIGREVRDAFAWAKKRGIDASQVRIVGSDALSVRYANAVALAGSSAERGEPNAAAHGLWRIAGEAGLLES